MSQSFTYYNSLNLQVVFDGIKQAIGNNVVFQDNTTAKIPNLQLPPEFTARLANIKNWWNLDRSEAGRRTYIDAFVYEAMEKSKSPSLIATAEEYIPSNRRRAGHGYLDYLLSAIDKETSAPIYTPSVILEAKAYIPGNPLNGQNQLLVEMLTLWQIKQTQQSLTRGVLTDGRYWKFYEMNMSSGLLLASSFYDAETEQGLTDSVALLAKFFLMYDSGNSAFL